ncbi:hypothetical protein C8T65DRAFT_786614 [Cerioporus squamosus]|nr:hypothetical protein C8T65DRAFT_786614 [Cerioporus squamosus]
MYVARVHFGWEESYLGLSSYLQCLHIHASVAASRLKEQPDYIILRADFAIAYTTPVNHPALAPSAVRMSSVTIHDLPLELHYAILDHLRGDRTALHASCLTCKVWLGHAQQSLYEMVQVDSKNSGAFRWTVMKRPELASYIRELTLYDVDRIPRPPPSLPLSGVRLLRLVGMDMSNPWIISALSTSKRSVRQLSLRDCHAENTESFLAFLSEMPNLKNIDIERGRLRTHESHDVYAVGPPDLQSLSVVGGESYDVSSLAVVSAFLADPGSYKNLLILKIHLDIGHLFIFDRFLAVVGPNLLELNLGIKSNGPLFPLSLGCCTNLLLFALEFRLAPPFQGMNHLYYVPLLLNTLAAPKLRRVMFAVKAVRAAQRDLSALDWERIGQLLAEERFAMVRRVIVHLMGGYAIRHLATRYIEERVPEVHTRGILRVVHNHKAEVKSLMR